MDTCADQTSALTATPSPNPLAVQKAPYLPQCGAFAFLRQVFRITLAAMAKRRKKKIERVIHLSAGPLPQRLAERFTDCRLIFSDASQLRHGGLAAILFEHPDSEPLVATRSVALTGSNELELQAAVFALEQADQHFPNQLSTLFSDNLDAVNRLNLAKAQGLAQDPELAETFATQNLGALLANTRLVWIKGHSTCRGNALADQNARMAAA